MSVSPHRVRKYMQVFDDLGVEVVDTCMTGSCHYKFNVTCCGKCKFFIAPFSPSDHRGIMNFRAMVKRWQRQIQEEYK